MKGHFSRRGPSLGVGHLVIAMLSVSLGGYGRPVQAEIRFEPDVSQPEAATAGDVSLASQVGGSLGLDGAHGWRQDCRTDRKCPTWTFQVDALMLWQGAIPSRPLYLDTNSRVPVLDANDLQTPVAIEPRYAIIYGRDDHRSFEVNYFGISGFNGEAVTPPSTGRYEMNNLAGLNFSNIDAAGAASDASLKSLEFNLRRRGWGDVQWLTGFRWAEWAQGLAIVDAYSMPANGIDVLGVSTINNLYGWQWGGDVMLWNRGGRLRVNGVAKAGVYYNHQAGQTTLYLTDRASPTGIVDANDTVSFVGETGFTSSYAITNWLSARLGYTLFWLAGVATPSDQLANTTVDPNLTPEARVSPYGSVLLHGVTTGLEARW